MGIMTKAKVEWTEVEITGPHDTLTDVAWPLWDYLWVQHSNGDYFLSRDQGATFNKVGRLRYKLWTLYRRLKLWMSGIIGEKND